MASITSSKSYIKCVMDYSTSRNSSGVIVTYSIYLQRLNNISSYGTIAYSVTVNGNSIGSGSGIKLTVPGNTAKYIVQNASYTVSAGAFASGGFTLAFSTTGDIDNFNHSGSAWVSYDSYATSVGTPSIGITDNGNNTFSFSVSPGSGGTNNGVTGLANIGYSFDNSSWTTVAASASGNYTHSYGPYSVSSEQTVYVRAQTVGSLNTSGYSSTSKLISYTAPDINYSCSLSSSVTALTLAYSTKAMYSGTRCSLYIVEDPNALFKITTSGAISNVKYTLAGISGTLSSMTAGVDKSISIDKDYIYTELSKSTLRNYVVIPFTCTFTLTSGSTVVNKSYSTNLVITVSTQTSDMRFEVLSLYKTSASNVHLRGKFTLPLDVPDSILGDTDSFAIYYYVTGQTIADSKSQFAIFSYVKGSSDKEFIVTGDIPMTTDESCVLYITSNNLYISDYYIEMSKLNFISLCASNIAPYASQDILLKKDKTVECVEIIETNENEIAFQKGGRLYCKEFVEVGGESIYKRSSVYDSVYTAENLNIIPSGTGIQIDGEATSTSGYFIHDIADSNIPTAYDCDIKIGIGGTNILSYINNGGIIIVTIRNSDTEEVAYLEIDTDSKLQSTLSNVPANCYLHMDVVIPYNYYCDGLIITPSVKTYPHGYDIQYGRDYSISAVEFNET